jgi:hypothetical protein
MVNRLDRVASDADDSTIDFARNLAYIIPIILSAGSKVEKDFRKGTQKGRKYTVERYSY